MLLSLLICRGYRLLELRRHLHILPLKLITELHLTSSA